MAAGFQFAHQLAFIPAEAAEILRRIPAAPGVFALRGESASAEPYLTRAADLRRRMTRLLALPEASAEGKPQTKRLNLRNRVHSIEYSVTGSEFESLLVLYNAASAAFGAVEARRRLRLSAPYCVRLTLEHAQPRLYVTNRISRRGLGETFGPFPSRLAAERYVDGVLDLFRLRRCYEDLDVSPEHPGCAYGEMRKCMAPCNLTSTPAEYNAEARAVDDFLRSHGQSLLATIAIERDHASAEMEFERAAAAHDRHSKVKAIAALADELVRPLPDLRAVIVQPAAPDADLPHAQEAAVYLVEHGCIHGPARLSTLGVRAVREQTSVGSSLFAQPLMLEAVPLGDTPVTATDSPETRAEAVLAHLRAEALTEPDPLTQADQLALLRRWYYRPEKQRTGECFLPNADGSWPVRRILRGAARMALGEPKAIAETDREAAPAAKVKILHEGRPDVERAVPVIAKKRTRRSQRKDAQSTTAQ